MAYAMKLTRPKCALCGIPAKVEVFTRLNATSGKYCATCGKGKVEQLNALEAKW